MGESPSDVVPEYAGRAVWQRIVPLHFCVAIVSSVLGVMWIPIAARMGFGQLMMVGMVAFQIVAGVLLLWGLVGLLLWPNGFKGWLLALLALGVTVICAGFSYVLVSVALSFPGQN